MCIRDRHGVRHITIVGLLVLRVRHIILVALYWDFLCLAWCKAHNILETVVAPMLGLLVPSVGHIILVGLYWDFLCLAWCEAHNVLEAVTWGTVLRLLVPGVRHIMLGEWLAYF